MMNWLLPLSASVIALVAAAMSFSTTLRLVKKVREIEAQKQKKVTPDELADAERKLKLLKEAEAEYQAIDLAVRRKAERAHRVLPEN